MSILSQNKDNSFFIKCNITDNNIFNKEKFNLEENNNRNNSISTNETFENDEEIDFNQDFFPKRATFKFTDFLVDNWEQKIKLYLDKINEQMTKIKNI